MTATVLDAMPELDYHAHPALSASGAKRLIATCPAIYKWERDNPPEPKREYDHGHAVHGLILGIGEPVVVVQAANWRTNAAKEQRDEAHAAGHVPVLAADWAEAQAAADAVKAHPIAGALLATGVAEQSVFWRDERWGIDRRTRFDWLTTIGDRPCIVDVKTANTADPRAFGRKAYDFGYDIQDTFYRDAAEALGHPDPAFLFIVVEKTRPYPVTVVELDAEAKRIGRARTDRALEIYRDCTAADTWPGYTSEIELVSLPRYATYDLENL